MISSNVTIIDYGIGNLLSVKRGLEKCGAKVVVSSDSKEILSEVNGIGSIDEIFKNISDKLDLIIE